MKNTILIHGREVGAGQPAYIIAEMSGNHNQSYEKAVEIIYAMKDAGADAVKIQTYTADTITLKSDRPEFQIGGGTLWDGKTLHDLYSEAFTPWEWQPKLKAVAEDLGMDLFSTPFDASSVEFLESMDVPAYKIASFEIVDIPLIRKVAATGKPIIISTGMASRSEIEDALEAAKGCEVALLKCTSAYPARPESMNLNTIPAMIKDFHVPVGLSDHTLDNAAAVTAVRLGACIIEKHFKLDQNECGPDSTFSLDPQAFRSMVDVIRAAEHGKNMEPLDPVILGSAQYGPSPEEKKSMQFRRSLFVVKDIAEGETFTNENVRSIRPANGLAPAHYDRVLGRKATKRIERGTPLREDCIAS
ncbi:pseudaminic acid synthase [Candidatus Peribacteria bacterium]|nr:pseudaminic acid synthase [Candidatus Peribacteria bacterium]